MISNTVRLARLRAMKRMILRVKPERLRMYDWWRRAKRTEECGSGGCLMGHAANCELIPGLVLPRVGYPSIPEYSPGLDPEQYMPKSDKHYTPKMFSGVSAAKAMLSIEEEQASFLCGVANAEGYRTTDREFYLMTPEVVAGRIQHLIDFYEAHG